MTAARRLSTVSSGSSAPTVARLEEVEPVREEEEEGAGSEEELELSQDSDQYSQGGLPEESMLEGGEGDGEVPPNLHQQLAAFIRSRPSLHQQVKILGVKCWVFNVHDLVK